MDDSNVTPKEELVARRLKRGDRYPDGRKVPLWGTYSPPPVYAREPQVVAFNPHGRDHSPDPTEGK